MGAWTWCKRCSRWRPPPGILRTSAFWSAPLERLSTQESPPTSQLRSPQPAVLTKSWLLAALVCLQEPPAPWRLLGYVGWDQSGEGQHSRNHNAALWSIRLAAVANQHENQCVVHRNRTCRLDSFLDRLHQAAQSAWPHAAPRFAVLRDSASCGGGVVTPTPGKGPPGGTPADSYTIVVTGTSGNVSHAASTQLRVN